jgi:hypothetical protein
MRELMTHHVPQLYPVLAGPFYQAEGAAREKEPMSPTPPNPITLMAADTLSIQTRNILCHAWLWFSALGCAGFSKSQPTLSAAFENDPYAAAHERHKPPPHIARASRAHRQLARIEDLLRGTGWDVKAPLALWQDAVGYLMARGREDREAWRARFVRQVRRMGIVDEEGLDRALSDYLPLGRIEGAWRRRLWVLVEEGRLEGDAQVGGEGDGMLSVGATMNMPLSASLVGGIANVGASGYVTEIVAGAVMEPLV